MVVVIMSAQKPEGNCVQPRQRLPYSAIVDRPPTQQDLASLVEAEPPTQGFPRSASHAQQLSIRFEHSRSKVGAVANEAEHPCHPLE